MLSFAAKLAYNLQMQGGGGAMTSRCPILRAPIFVEKFYGYISRSPWPLTPGIDRANEAFSFPMVSAMFELSCRVCEFVYL